MSDRTKYRRLQDLFVVGRELILADDAVVWLQVLNPFELDQARSRAGAVRSRLVMALEEHGSDELVRCEAAFVESGTDVAAAIVAMRGDELLVKVMGEVNGDPEWAERIEIMRSLDEKGAKEPTEAERKVVNDLNQDYLKEIYRLHEEEIDLLRSRLESYEKSDLLDEFKKVWIDQRGNELAVAEFTMSELSMAARVCDASPPADGEQWDHGQCDHTQRVWSEREEVRSLPEELQLRLAHAMRELNLSAQEAKTFRPEA